MRRLCSLLSSAMVISIAMALPAHAKCTQERIGHALEGSDSVWWATVTKAEPTKAHESQWKLTVEIVDVLKGSGTDGDDGVVYFSTCAPPSSEADRRAANGFIDDTMLFWGTDRHGALVNPSDELTLDGDALHERALAVLGSPPPAQAAVVSEPHWLSLSVVLALGFGVLLVIVGTIASIVLRNRSRPA